MIKNPESRESKDRCERQKNALFARLAIAQVVAVAGSVACATSPDQRTRYTTESGTTYTGTTAEMLTEIDKLIDRRYDASRVVDADSEEIVPDPECAELEDKLDRFECENEIPYETNGEFGTEVTLNAFSDFAPEGVPESTCLKENVLASNQRKLPYEQQVEVMHKMLRNKLIRERAKAGAEFIAEGYDWKIASGDNAQRAEEDGVMPFCELNYSRFAIRNMVTHCIDHTAEPCEEWDKEVLAAREKAKEQAAIRLRIDRRRYLRNESKRAGRYVKENELKSKGNI